MCTLRWVMKLCSECSHDTYRQRNVSCEHPLTRDRLPRHATSVLHPRQPAFPRLAPPGRTAEAPLTRGVTPSNSPQIGDRWLQRELQLADNPGRQSAPHPSPHLHHRLLEPGYRRAKYIAAPTPHSHLDPPDPRKEIDRAIEILLHALRALHAAAHVAHEIHHVRCCSRDIPYSTVSTPDATAHRIRPSATAR